MSTVEDLFCPHVEADSELYPDGASCLPCARVEEYDPDAYETDAEWRERLGIPPLSSSPWSAVEPLAEPHPDWTCRGCGKPLPEDSSVRREFCSSRCRSAAHRAGRRG
ncbi:hypothetical protein [Streptomyces coelicoflavus]|uniref:hypothetical protein n=1 Tax=Streptomyces coelicoflavus TaxID=285562 RepID=UPI0036A32D14